jgi:hypothetical protein
MTDKLREILNEIVADNYNIGVAIQEIRKIMIEKEKVKEIINFEMSDVQPFMNIETEKTLLKLLSKIDKEEKGSV